MKARQVVGFIGIVAAIIGTIALGGCSSSNTASSGNASPSAAATRSSEQVLPVDSNPIVNTATKAGLEVTSIMVENNVDSATQQALPDQLQIDLTNAGTETMSDLEIFYQMADSKTKETEGYYQKLTGLTLAPGETKTVYFDGGSGAGHYPENQYSLYRTSQNEVVFDVQVSAPGFQPATATVAKDAGTGEAAGE